MFDFHQDTRHKVRSALSRAAIRRRIAAPAVIGTMLAMPAWGQLAGKGAIRITVTDSTGAAIPGATIIVTNNAKGTRQTFASTGAGDYEASLDPAKYTISVSSPGFNTFVQQNVQVDALETFAVNAVLQTGSVDQTVTVSDAPPTLESSNATLGVTLEQEQYAALPILQDGGGQRRATDLAQLLPGVSANVSNGNATTNSGVVNGGGSRGAVSSIYINGVPITNAAGEGDPRFVWTSFAAIRSSSSRSRPSATPLCTKARACRTMLSKAAATSCTACSTTTSATRRSIPGASPRPRPSTRSSATPPNRSSTRTSMACSSASPSSKTSSSSSAATRVIVIRTRSPASSRPSPRCCSAPVTSPRQPARPVFSIPTRPSTSPSVLPTSRSPATSGPSSWA